MCTVVNKALYTAIISLDPSSGPNQAGADSHPTPPTLQVGGKQRLAHGPTSGKLWSPIRTQPAFPGARSQLLTCPASRNYAE